MVEKYWKRFASVCRIQIRQKEPIMKKWKRIAIIFIGIDIFLIFILISEYYEFFIKDCQDAFPFHYCPWGSESMGMAWRSADAYLTGIVSSCSILLFFVPVSLYYYFKQKNYKVSLLLAISPILISWLKVGLEYIFYYYA